MAVEIEEYRGFIDGVIGDQMFGWCWQKGSDRPIWLEMLIDDVVVATFPANELRADLLGQGIGNGRHGFVSPHVLGNVAPDAIIKLKIKNIDGEIIYGGQKFSEYKRLESPRAQVDSSGAGYIRAKSLFKAISAAEFPWVSNTAAFQALTRANLMIEPAGQMRMPPWRVMDRAADQLDKLFPAVQTYPAMQLTVMENGYCLQCGPPMLPFERKLINDYIIPWAKDNVPWFALCGQDQYSSHEAIDLSDIRHDVDTGFYLDHPVSHHFGHFVGDCICRLFAWDIVRQMFGDVKLIIARRSHNAFQMPLLAAFDVTDSDIVWVEDGLVRCKRMVMATRSLGVERYASPSSVRVWHRIRDHWARRDISRPNRIYLSRRGVADRKLMNEAEVEATFQRHGFTIVRPETISVQEQIALVSNALLVAGPTGSGMFNLAFQGRLRSVFVLAPENWLNRTERLLCAGSDSDVWYRLGSSIVPPSAGSPGEMSWTIDTIRLASDVADWVAASERGYRLSGSA